MTLFLKGQLFVLLKFIFKQLLVVNFQDLRVYFHKMLILKQCLQNIKLSLLLDFHLHDQYYQIEFNTVYCLLMNKKIKIKTAFD